MKPQIIIITGKTGMGKSLIANEFSKNNEGVFLDENELAVDHPFAFRNVNKSTKYLIIEDVVELSNIYNLIISKTIIINKKSIAPIEIDTPTIVITLCQNWSVKKELRSLGIYPKNKFIQIIRTEIL